jgi:hypothetical protein
MEYAGIGKEYIERNKIGKNSIAPYTGGKTNIIRSKK